MKTCLRCHCTKPNNEFPDEGNWCNACLYRMLRKEKERGERILFQHRFEITEKEWESLKHKHNYRCVCCGKPETREHRLVRDHVIPYSKGGSPTIENFQPLCNYCNSKKWTKETDYR